LANYTKYKLDFGEKYFPAVEIWEEIRLDYWESIKRTETEDAVLIDFIAFHPLNRPEIRFNSTEKRVYLNSKIIYQYERSEELGNITRSGPPRPILKTKPQLIDSVISKN
jgi:hypothetical protein